MRTSACRRRRRAGTTGSSCATWTAARLLLNIALPYNIALAGNAALAPNGTLARSHSFQLPDGQRGTGRIQVQLFADQNTGGQGSFAEYDAAGAAAENNNGASIEFDAAARAYANLVLASLSAPLTGRGGETIRVEWSVRNDGGSAAAGGWVDRIVLSNDTTIGDADDVQLGELLRGASLDPGAVYSAGRDVTLPLLLDGSFYLAVISDATQQVLEPDTRADNTSAPRAIGLEAPRADLQVEVVDAPASARGGDSVTVAWRVRNAGDAVTNVASWKDALYLSADDVFDASDVLLAEVNHGTVLEVGASYSASAKVFAPNGLNGSYRFIVRTDAGNTVFEAALDGNNTTAAIGATALAPAPVADLQVTAVSLPALGIPGETQNVSWTVRNAGDATAAGTWTDRLYLSSTGTLAGAVLVASFAQGRNLAAGASYTQSLDIVLPALPDGDYTLLVVADALNQIFENPHEDNNSGASAAPLSIVHRDLRVDALRAPASAMSTGTVQFEWDVSNAGSSDFAGSWIDRVYLSRDGVVGAGDLLVAERSITRSLAVGASYTESASFVLPVDATGDYQLIVISDASAQIAELDAEGNNQLGTALAVDLAPYADLVVTSVVAPDLTIADPALVTIDWTVRNDGNGAGARDCLGRRDRRLA